VGSALRTILQRNFALGELYPMYTAQSRAAFRQMLPEVKDKIKELVLYSISEDYFWVRQHLGTVIG